MKVRPKSQPPILPAPPPGLEMPAIESQPPSQPENPLWLQPENPPAENSGSIDPAAVRSGAEFDAAAGVGATEAPLAGEAIAAAPAPIDNLPFDIWYKSAHAVFMVASAVSRLQSLKFDAGDETARGAFLALYETCEEVPALHFLLRPQGKWMARAGAIAAFAVPMAQGVRVEIAARRGKGRAAPIGAPAGDREAAAADAPGASGAGAIPEEFFRDMAAASPAKN